MNVTQTDAEEEPSNGYISTTQDNSGRMITSDSVSDDCRMMADEIKPAAKLRDKIQTFLSLSNVNPQRRIAFVTSGVPNVPIEKNIVRYFSFGSHNKWVPEVAERLTQKGYNMIFLHGKGNPLPYLRHLNSERTEDDVCVELDPNLKEFVLKGRKVYETFLRSLLTIIEAENDVERKGLRPYYSILRSDPSKFLSLVYTTIHEYMYFLREILTLLTEYRKQVIVFLGANMPWCFIPDEHRPKHKISSNTLGTVVKLHLMPNAVLDLINELKLEAFVVMLKPENTKTPISQYHQKSISLSEAHPVIDIISDKKDNICYMKFKNKDTDIVQPYDTACQSLEKTSNCEILPIGYNVANRILNVYEKWVSQGV